MRYILNEEGYCEQITYEHCTFNSIIKNYNDYKSSCNHFCHNDNNKVLIQYNGLDINNLDYNDDIKNISQHVKTCLSN